MPLKNTNDASHAARKWFVKLSSGNASKADYQAWQAWRTADPANENAWQKIEQITGQLKSLASEVGITKTLRRLYTQKPSSEGRRNILKQMAVVLAVGTTSYVTYKKQPWQELMADYSTSTGEHREITLADGTHLFMNTSTAVNIAFNETSRTLELIEGEVLIETGHGENSADRPFILKTRHGAVTALGTHFSVRDHQQYSSVSVFEGAVLVAPEKGQTSPLRLNAGESVRFSIAETMQKDLADASTTLWSQGFIIVDEWTLGELIAELSRYRRGLLQCDPTISHLQVSGSFPTDTDAALEILSHKFPIRIQTLTRYWAQIKPA